MCLSHRCVASGGQLKTSPPNRDPLFPLLIRERWDYERDPNAAGTWVGAYCVFNSILSPTWQINRSTRTWMDTTRLAARVVPLLLDRLWLPRLSSLSYTKPTRKETKACRGGPQPSHRSCVRIQLWIQAYISQNGIVFCWARFLLPGTSRFEVELILLRFLALLKTRVSRCGL